MNFVIDFQFSEDSPEIKLIEIDGEETSILTEYWRQLFSTQVIWFWMDLNNSIPTFTSPRIDLLFLPIDL